jgi:hypothetical protein
MDLVWLLLGALCFGLAWLAVVGIASLLTENPS